MKKLKSELTKNEIQMTDCILSQIMNKSIGSHSNLAQPIDEQKKAVFGHPTHEFVESNGQRKCLKKLISNLEMSMES